MKDLGEIRIGISGWRYPGWRGIFYPTGLPQRKELNYAASRFRTIELNGSFYSLQRPESFLRWREQTPEDFVFAVKGSRYLTHMRKLKAIDTGLANFFAQGLLALGAKLGPILWQFPPPWMVDGEQLEAFFQRLPRTQREAATAGTNVTLNSELLAYSRSHGLFLGVDLKGVTLSQNLPGTIKLYGNKYHSLTNILDGHAPPPHNQSAQQFEHVLQQYFGQARVMHPKSPSPAIKKP